jgi:hypothetical protein
MIKSWRSSNAHLKIWFPAPDTASIVNRWDNVSCNIETGERGGGGDGADGSWMGVVSSPPRMDSTSLVTRDWWHMPTSFLATATNFQFAEKIV